MAGTAPISFKFNDVVFDRQVSEENRHQHAELEQVPSSEVQRQWTPHEVEHRCRFHAQACAG
jgi:hypothetical protein